MTRLNKENIEMLAGIEGAPCISIYLPTRRGGQEVLDRQDQTSFKRQLDEITRRLEKEWKLGLREMDRLLKPAKKLQEDDDFWRHSEEGMACFLCNGEIWTFTLPLTVQPKVYVAHDFFLVPLLPLFFGTGKFYLLRLNLHDPVLYEGDRESLTQIHLETILPEKVEAVVGFDYRQKFLNFRTQMSGQAGTFHGHGEGKDERKDEIMAYLREVNKALTGFLSGRNTPLVVASLDYLFPMYKEVNTYPFLYPEGVIGNAEHLSLTDLHQRAWNVIGILFEKEHLEKIDQYNIWHDTGRTSFDIQEIIPAALGGRVDTLFLVDNGAIWGMYDPGQNIVTIHPEQKRSSTSLINQAAIHTFLNGGKVYLETKEDLPQPFSNVNALFRY